MLIKAFRYDVSEMKSAYQDHRGYLRADAFLARTGIQNYVMPDGTTRREYRPDDEVFSDDSLATLSGSVVTNNHPSNPLDTNNTRHYAVGFLDGHPERMGENLKDSITVYDDRSIDDVMKKGKNQISQGYHCDIEMTPGTHDSYGPYDAIQRNIRHNHTAIVQDGRAGPNVKIKLDSVEGKDVEIAYSYRCDTVGLSNEKNDADKEINDASEKKDGEKSESMAESKKTGEETMIILKLDGGLELQLKDDQAGVAQIISSKMTEHNTLKADNEKLSTLVTTLKVEIEKKDAQIVELKKITTDEKEMAKLAQERIDALSMVKKILPQETKVDELSTLDIQKKIVTKCYPDIDVAKHDESFIKGMARGITFGFKTDATKELEKQFEGVARGDTGDKAFNKDAAEEGVKNFYKDAHKGVDPKEYKKYQSV